MRQAFIIVGFSAVFFLLSMTSDCFLFEEVEAAVKSHLYGDVMMEEGTKDNAVLSVTFRHWTHRDKYTCRLCHVDLEFTQVAGETGVTEADNRDGRYCGTCHNGKLSFPITTCSNCHPKNIQHKKELDKKAKKDFFTFRKTMPPSVYGNKVDWMEAEEKGNINLKDSLPGITLPQQKTMVNKRDEPRTPILPGLPDIIFSHSKHVKWNGCGMCHPEPYALETGKTNITMKQIIAGEYCGRCHGTVAFPLNDCTRCHSKPVNL